jgi:hypothetical protein
LVSNGVLIGVGQYYNYVIVVKIPLDSATGVMLMSSATYIFKQGFISKS